MYGVQTICQSPVVDKQVYINNGPFFQGLLHLLLRSRKRKTDDLNGEMNNNFTYRGNGCREKTKQEKGE